MVPSRRGLRMFGAAGTLLAAASCSENFDTTRHVPAERGTVGQEVFHVVCERVDVGESPDDLDFSRARPFCTGASASPDGGTTAMDSGVASMDAGAGDHPVVGPKVLAMAALRPQIVDALDRTIPPALYDNTDNLLVQLLPLYGTDNGQPGVDGGRARIRLLDGGFAALGEDLLPQSTRGIANLLNGIAADDDAVNALSHLSYHMGFRPLRVALGVTRGVLGYPQLNDVLNSTLALLREPVDGRPPGPAYNDWMATLDVLRGEMGTSAPTSAMDRQRGTTLDATLDLLYRTDPGLGTGKPRLMVLRDPEGMPRVVTDLSGAPPPPFVDMDHDGNADSAGGRFLDAARNPIAAPTPFYTNDDPSPPSAHDDQGRAYLPGTQSVAYQYLDLDQTVLGALLRDARGLVDPANNAALDLANGASVLLGTPTPATRDYMLQTPCTDAHGHDATCAVPPITFQSYDPSHGAPLVDAAHAAGIALTSSNIDPILTTVQGLLTTQESALARATDALLGVKRSADMHPEAVMDPRSNIWDDVVAVLQQAAQEPGLLEDLIAAAGDPNTALLMHDFGTYATYRDRVEPNWSGDWNASLASQTLSQHVDRTRPDTQDLSGGSMDNRSAMQRFMHLIHDLNGVELCNKEGAYVEVTSLLHWPLTGGYHRCELLRVPDAAVFYLKLIDGSGRLQMMDGTLPAWLGTTFPSGVDALLESKSGIHGFTQTPTPQAINRLVFMPDSDRTSFIQHLMDVPVTRDGLAVRDVHPGTIFVWELYDFYTHIRPLVHAFVSHGDAGAHLFVQLVSALHLHYASMQAGQYQNTNPSGPLYSTMDGAVKYEGIVADAMSGDLGDATGQLVRALPSIDAGGGHNGRDAIAMAGRMLLDPNALTNIAYRDGRTSTVESDGTTAVPHPNLYYLFADAMNGIDDAFASHPANLMAWQNGRSHAVDTFLTVDGAGTASAQFHDRAFPIVGRLLVGWLRDRLAAHRALGDADAWARGMGNRLADTTSGPTFSALLALMADLGDDVPTRTNVGGLLTYLMDDSVPGNDSPFSATLTAAGDLLQTLRDEDDLVPLVRALAPAFQRRIATPQGTIPDGAAATGMRMLDRSSNYDTDHVLSQLLVNMVARPAAPSITDEPLVVMANAIAEVHRHTPGADGPLEPQDVRDVFHQVSDFLTDGSRGMEQFYYIVQHRRF